MASRAAEEGRTRSPSRLQVALLGRLPVPTACVDADLRVAYANDAFSAAFGVAAGAELRWAEGPLAQLGAAAREVIGTRADAEIAIAGQPGAVRVFVIDPRHAGVVVGAPAAREPVRPDEQAALLRIATLVARDAPEDVVFTAASEQAARLVGADAGGVLRFIGAERAVIVGVWREDGIRGMPVNAELDFDAANSAVGRVAATGRPARADGYEGSSGELPLVMRAIGLRATVAAPVHVDERVWGAIVASSTAEDPLPEGSEHRLAGVAELVGLSVANAEAARGLAEANDELRRRLERELHGGAKQHLLALALKLRLAAARADADPELQGLLEAAQAEVREASASLRELAREVHPAALSERGLAPALQGLAARSAVPVHLRALPGRRFSATVETTAYLAVLEALANAVDHAGATQATVLVADRGDRLVVEVRDDGAAVAGPRAAAGLRGIADRTAAVGGRLVVEPADAGGTIVRAEIPVER
jgi:signal transduction histidine kinase